MSPPRFTRRAAAALFLERQQLDRPRGRRLTAASLSHFASETGGVQLDSINVVDRAHYLTLWSRFGAFDRTRLDHLIYRRRVLFEYWSHVACMVATVDFPAFRRAMLDYQRRHKGWGSWLKKHAPTLKLVEEQVRLHGPIGSAHFEQPQKKRSAGWWNWKPAAHALEYLWMTGVITTHSRKHFHKRFDLLERVLGDRLKTQPLTTEAYRRWHITRSLHAMGAATETDLRMYMTFPRIPAAQRRPWLRGLIEEEVVTEVEIEGARGPWFALTADLPHLARAGRKRAPSTGTTFLCPFDSLLWHRERVVKLFGFDYKIEVYVPQPKRKYGYYVLPLFHDGHFIGRADVKTHRISSVLEIRALYFEPWFVAGAAPPAAAWGKLDHEAAFAGAADAMRSLATMVGVRDVKLGSVAPRALAAPMRRALATSKVSEPMAVEIEAS